MCICVCAVLARAFPETKCAAGHSQTPRCCQLNYPLSGLVTGPYRCSADGSVSTGGRRIDGGSETGPSLVLLKRFKVDSSLSLGPLPSLSAYFFFSSVGFFIFLSLPLRLFYSLSCLPSHLNISSQGGHISVSEYRSSRTTESSRYCSSVMFTATMLQCHSAGVIFKLSRQQVGVDEQ